MRLGYNVYSMRWEIWMGRFMVASFSRKIDAEQYLDYVEDEKNTHS